MTKISVILIIVSSYIKIQLTGHCHYNHWPSAINMLPEVAKISNLQQKLFWGHQNLGYISLIDGLSLVQRRHCYL